MRLALTREISPALARCELTHLARQPIDVARARAQHREYEQRLVEAGCRVERIASGPDMPDSVFVEDVAVVFEALALLTRPGAPSRRVETPAVAEALRAFREIHSVEPPGTLDGGDVLVVGRQVFVGRSSRTNDAAIVQIRRLLAPHGYSVDAVEVSDCLHLKSCVTAVGPDLLLMNPELLPGGAFAAFDRIEVDPSEPMAANALAIDGCVIYPVSFPRTLARLARHGLQVRTVEVGELQKAEGAVTCCSLLLEV